ncbi:hypothetical protein D9M71_746040 [compost metagenome]
MVNQRGFATGGNHPHDQVLELLAIAGLVLVPDDQVDHQAFLSPVGMGLDHLLHQLDVLDGGDLQQHDGQVTGNSLAPEARLIASVGH